MLCARYPHNSEYAFGGYTAGSGSASLLGASFYALTTSTLGIKPTNVFAIVGFAPVVAVLAYAFILPDPETVPGSEDEKEGIVRLPWKDKLRIIKPMFVPYMLPLASIFFIENSIAQVFSGQCFCFHPPLPTRIYNHGR